LFESEWQRGLTDSPENASYSADTRYKRQLIIFKPMRQKPNKISSMRLIATSARLGKR